MGILSSVVFNDETTGGDMFTELTKEWVIIVGVLFFLPLKCAFAAVEVHGENLSCFDASGIAVPILFSDAAIPLGGGAYASTGPNGPSIMLSPKYMDGLSRQAAIFVFFHECAHVALPIGIGLGSSSQETTADCYAANEMGRKGFIKTWAEFADAMGAITNAPGSAKGHPPGKERIVRASACVNFTVAKFESNICEVVGKVFVRGKDFFKEKEENISMSGFECSKNSSGAWMNCYRYSDNQKAQLEMAEKLKEALQSCLAPRFVYSAPKSYVTVFLADFYDEDSGQRVDVGLMRDSDALSVDIGFD